VSARSSPRATAACSAAWVTARRGRIHWSRSAAAVAASDWPWPASAASSGPAGPSRSSVATTVVTVTQLGYAVGLALLLPLGDLLENRSLASRTLIATAVALAGAALAPSFGVFLVLAALTGLTSVVVQILVPLAAHLAPADQRGRFVGQVMSGLLLGILLARTVSSLVSAVLGWQAIFAFSAVAMLVVSFALVRVLPQRKPERPGSYGTLLRSVVTIARAEPVLRRRAACQALMFASFTAFWTAISFELEDHHGFTQTEVGLFALVGAAGALAAPLAGRLGDRGYGRIGSGLALALGVAAMLLAAVGSSSLVLLALSGILLDLAVQSHQVLSQRVVYGLRPDARARVNTVFMCSIFIAGAAASALTGWLHDVGGWSTVALVAAAFPAVALALWALPSTRPAEERAARVVPVTAG
jgi:predicted MFS family arabinose efflux permease